MPVDVVTTTVIDAPVGIVAAFAADPSNAPRWYSAITSAELLTPPPVGSGAQIAFTARFLGRRLSYTYEIVELIPERRLVMRTAQGPFPMETTYAWTPVAADRTAMSLRNRGAPRGFPAVLAPLMARAVRRANRGDLARLKALLERAPAT